MSRRKHTPRREQRRAARHTHTMKQLAIREEKRCRKEAIRNQRTHPTTANTSREDLAGLYATYYQPSP